MSTAVGDAQTHMDEQARYAEKLEKAKREILTDPNELIEFLQDMDYADHFIIHLAGMFKAWLDDFDCNTNAHLVCDAALKHPIVKKLAEQIVNGENP